MTIRVQVLEGAEEIEVIRFYRYSRCNDKRLYATVEEALSWVRYHLGREHELARKERFVTQLEKQGKQAFKELERSSPYNVTKTKE